MPNIIMEYSDNLEFDIQDLFARLHEEMLATGVVRMKGLKSRAIRHTEYRLADGHEGYKFIHVALLIREGRTVEKKEEMSQRVMKVLEETFADEVDNGYIALSTDIKELLHGIALTKNNIPLEGVPNG